MTTYQIGEQQPFRLTNQSAKALLYAIVRTGAKVVSINQDTTCPPIHICVRIQIPDGKRTIFQTLAKVLLNPVEEAGGQ